MSSKSKHPPRRLSNTAQMNRDLLIFLWAWVTVAKPGLPQIRAVADEIKNVAESLRRGLINETMIARQLESEYDVFTDWTRRDRG